MHASETYELPDGVTRLLSKNEISKAREDRKIRAAGGVPKDGGKENNIGEDEAARRLHQDVITPGKGENYDLLKRLSLFLDEVAQPRPSLKRQRDDDDVADNLHNCISPVGRSNSSNSSNVATCVATVQCLNCDEMSTTKANYCIHCGTQLRMN